jgi:L-2,4-diaminobutyrate decarboxylase
MTGEMAFTLSPEVLEDLGNNLATLLGEVYQPVRPMPEAIPPLPALPRVGGGAGVLPELWRTLLEGSARLGSPLMSGHMDTAPHPFAVFTQAIVSALNNNMLFREISPIGSAIEEQLIRDFIERLALGSDWAGTWASGGSIANLTALFCAVGGYESDGVRDNVYILYPESGHKSLSKAASIIGIPKARTVMISCDDGGRMDPNALAKEMAKLPSAAKPIVVAVLGGTIHGSVDDVEVIAKICEEADAWLHVDAIYGGALMFSHLHRHILRSLDKAHSIVIGPQKWMYVPRVSAAILIRGQDLFDQRLGVQMPYSLSGETHRGFWGVQGSRPADAVVLWTLLQSIGTDAIGHTIDQNMAITQEFHKSLTECENVSPAHRPDLNLQVIRTKTSASEVQRDLTEDGRLWASLSQWRGEQFLRTVLLSPSLDREYLNNFCASLEKAAA